MNSRTLCRRKSWIMTPDLITLEDEAGQDHQCEVIDTVDHNGGALPAVVPYGRPGKMLEEDAQLIIMRVTEENGEEFLDIVEDDEELAAVSRCLPRAWKSCTISSCNPARRAAALLNRVARTAPRPENGNRLPCAICCAYVKSY